MKDFFVKKHITERVLSSSISYIFDDSDCVNVSQFKVVENQKKTYVACYKLLKNGKEELLYDISGYKSLVEILDKIDSNTFFEIINKVLKIVSFTQQNGFLNVNNLLLFFNRIFITSDYKDVFLIYLPIRNSLTDDEENLFILKNQILQYVKNNNLFNYSYLFDDRNCSVEQLVKILTEIQNSKKIKIQPTLRFSSADKSVEFLIKKEKYIIGRKSNTIEVDGIIVNNASISRAHCKINYQNNNYFITDNQSTHGTYVNNKKLVPYEPCKIKNGDIVRLAFNDFYISISED